MASINLGSSANDGNGTTLRDAGTILNNTGLRKNNYAATAAPTAGDDTGDGYEVGSIWLDATNDRIYIAQDVTSTAAVWDELLTDGSGNALTAKTTLVDDDDLLAFDSAASGAAKTSKVSQFSKKAVEVNAITAASYTLVLGDQSKVVTMSNAGANTLTIPTNASVAFPTGSVIVVQQIGAGATTIDATTGVTLNGVSGGNGTLTAQWSSVSLLKTATDTWLAMGDIGTVA